MLHPGKRMEMQVGSNCGLLDLDPLPDEMPEYQKYNHDIRSA
jgi:hypothetical protein